LEKIYPDSRLLKFNKAASNLFSFDLHSIREYDLIFTGTTIQRTKNFDLFYSMIDRMLSIKPDISIALVGVTEGAEKLKQRWDGHDIDIFARVPKDELCRLFNRSKIHIVTSGRDCFPRTIPESIVCGCYVIALDILSDGLTVLQENPLMGMSIDTSDEILLVKPSYSVSIKLTSDRIIHQIIEQIEIKRNHLLISTLGRSLFSIEGMTQLDMIWQEVDLSLKNSAKSV
jgi:hypothetical protein